MFLIDLETFVSFFCIVTLINHLCVHVVYRYRTTMSATESQRFTIRQVPIGEFCKLCTNLNTIFALKYSQCLDFLQQNRLNQITDVLSTGWHNHFPLIQNVIHILTCTNSIFE